MSVNKRPQALVMCPDLPYPIVAGGQMRMASICEALSKSCRVHMVCVSPAIPRDTLSWSNGLHMTIENFNREAAGPIAAWGNRLLMVLTMNNLRRNPKEHFFYNTVYRRILPDLVWLETPYLLRYALPWRNETPLVVDYWGTSDGAKRLFNNTIGFRKAAEWLTWRAAYGGERRYASRLSDIVCVSGLDGDHFRSLAPQCRIWPIPIGIVKFPIAADAESPLADDDFTMIFTGDLSYAPNVDAAVFFSHHIFPLIRKDIPGATFRVVGRNPSPSVLDLCKESGIVVEGFVPDLSKIIRRSSIYVLPMRLGSGIRSKLFDVFPLGKAIVTTSIGAEGLELHHDRNCLIADTASDFAGSCIQLLTNAGMRRRLGEEVKRLASDVYTQANIDRMVRNVIETIVYNNIFNKKVSI